MKSYNRRSNRGLAASLLLVILLLAIVTACSLAVDVSHGIFLRAQLQSATDAGALAGAQELVKDTISAGDRTRALDQATTVTAGNYADNLAVSSSSPDTTVTVTVDGTSMPRTVTVTATRLMSNTFARIFGAGTSPVSARSVAGASKGVRVLSPGQAFPLAVSLDYVPTRGAQSGLALNSYIGPNALNQEFSVVLNPQGAKNAAWLRDWDGTDNPDLVFGQTTLTINGVQSNKVQDLQIGQTLILPIIQGGPPFNDTRTIIGVIGFKITRMQFPLTVTGTLKDPVIVGGQLGTPILPSASYQDNLFLQDWSPWQVLLLQ